MRYRVMFELTPRTGMAGSAASSRKVLNEPTAVAIIDMNGSWDIEKNAQGFMRQFGARSGRLKKDLPWPLTNGVALLGMDGKSCLSLDYFLVNPRAKVYGCGYWNLKGNQYQNYVFFRRILDPLKMTRAERIQEMVDIAGEEMLLQKIAAEAADFAHPRSLATVAAILALCASNPVGWFAGALAVLLGVAGAAQDYVTLQPLWKVFQDRSNYSRNEEDLREGAAALAEVLAKIIANFVTGKVISGAAQRVPFSKIKECFTNKKPADWENAAREAKAKGLDEPAAPARGTGPLGLRTGIRGVKEQHHYSSTHLTEAEFAGYRDISNMDGGGAIVVREPKDVARAVHLEDGVIARSKEMAVKTKSLKGDLHPDVEPFRGMLAIDATDVHPSELKYVREFDLGIIHPKFKHLGRRKMYQVSPTAQVKGIKNQQILGEYYFVEVGGGKYLMVDRGMGTPILPDVDILAYAPVRGGKIGASTVDLLKGLRQKLPFLRRKQGQTDDLVQAHVMNQAIRRHEKTGNIYDQTQHSEAGGSRSFVDGNNKPRWNPEPGDLTERLIMFVQGRCIVFDNWYAYRDFCNANNLQHLCPWQF